MDNKLSKSKSQTKNKNKGKSKEYLRLLESGKLCIHGKKMNSGHTCYKCQQIINTSE